MLEQIDDAAQGCSKNPITFVSEHVPTESASAYHDDLAGFMTRA